MDKALVWMLIRLPADPIRSSAELFILLVQDIRYPTEAKVSFERAVAIGEADLGTDHPDVAIWHNNLSNVLHDLRRLQRLMKPVMSWVFPFSRE